MQRRLNQKSGHKKHKISTRAYHVFEKAIMDLVDGEHTVSDMMELRKTAEALIARIPAEIVKTAESEKTHPVYLALLYLVSAQFEVLQGHTEWSQKSNGFMQQALSYLEQHESHLLTDPEWLRQQHKLLKMWNHYGILVLNKLTDMIRDSTVTRVSVITAGHFAHEKEYIKKFCSESFEGAVKSLRFIKEKQAEVAVCTWSLKKISGYYKEEYFSEFNFIHALFSIVQSSIWKSVQLNKKDDINIQQHLTQWMLDCAHNKRLVDINGLAMNPSNLLYLVLLSHRLVVLRDVFYSDLRVMDKAEKRFTENQLYNKDELDSDVVALFLDVIHKCYHVVKNNNRRDDAKYCLQYYADSIAFGQAVSYESFKKIHPQFSQYLEANPQSNQDISLHVLSVWFSVLNILGAMKYHTLSMLNHHTRHVANISFSEKLLQLSKNEEWGRPAAALIYNAAVSRRMLEEINAILTSVKESIIILKTLSSNNMPMLEELLPLPNSIRAFLAIEQLPAVASFMDDGNEIQQSDLSALQECCTTIRDIFLIFNKNELWFMKGQQLTSLFNDGLTILNTRLDAVNQKQSELDKALSDSAAVYNKKKEDADAKAKRFEKEETDRARLRHEKIKEKRLAERKAFEQKIQSIVSHTQIRKDDFSESDNFVLDPYAVSSSDASNYHASAMCAFSKKNYARARELFVKYGQAHSDYKVPAQEGIFINQAACVMGQIIQLQRELLAIAVSTKKVQPQQAKACCLEVESLHDEYHKLLKEYADLLHAMQGASHLHLSFLEEWRVNLERAWIDVASTKEAVVLRLNRSRYEKIMSLGFKAEKIEDPEDKHTYFEIGIPEHVYGKKITNKKGVVYKRFQKIFSMGEKAFIERGEQNLQEFGESPYASLRDALYSLDKMIHSVRLQLGRYAPLTPNVELLSSSSSSSSSSSTFSSSSSSSSSLAASSSFSSSSSSSTSRVAADVSSSDHAFSEAPSTTEASFTTSSTSTPSAIPKVLSEELDMNTQLQYFCQSKLLMHAEKTAISTWVKAHAEGLYAFVQRGFVESDLAYECFSSWVLTPTIEERLAFLNETGLLRWFLSVKGIGPLISEKKLTGFNQRLDQLAEWLRKLPLSEWQPDLILAQIIATIIMSVFDSKWLLDNLIHFGLVDKPLWKMCHSLQLSSECQSALHALLVTHLRMVEKGMIEKVSPHRLETLQILDDAALKYNRPILSSVNVQITPVCVYVRGSSVYCSLIKTTHVPYDIDVHTNLPVTAWQFDVSLHSDLADQHVYQRVLKNKQLEQGISITWDMLPMMAVNKHSDFTINQVVNHLGLRNMVYGTQEAYDDLLHKKVLRFVQPKEKVQSDLKLLLLRPLIAGNNTTYYLEDISFNIVREFLALERQKAYAKESAFLTPLLEPGILLHFLLVYCVYRSAEQYLTLSYHYQVLPLLFPIPFAALPLNANAHAAFKESLLQFDLDREKNIHQDGWMLLAKLIAIVLDKVIAPLPGGKLLMSEALQRLPEFLPDKSDLWSLTQHYVEFYARERAKVALVSSQSMLNNLSSMPSLQGPIEPTSSQAVNTLNSPNL